VTADALTHAIRRLAAHESLDGASITRAFDVVMRGEGSPTQVAALLMALRVKGETSEEVAGVVEALRSAMVVLPAAGGATAAGPVSLSATPAPLAGAQAAGGDTEGAASIWSTPAEFAPPE